MELVCSSIKMEISWFWQNFHYCLHQQFSKNNLWCSQKFHQNDHIPFSVAFVAIQYAVDASSWVMVILMWVRSRNCGCLVTWFCYRLIAKPGNKTATVSWPDPSALGFSLQYVDYPTHGLMDKLVVNMMSLLTYAESKYVLLQGHCQNYYKTMISKTMIS